MEETTETLYLEHSFYDAETWTMRKVGQKCLKKFRNMVLDAGD
jgi:hypothetical protein